MSEPPRTRTASAPRRGGERARGKALDTLRELCGLGLRPELLVPAVLEALHALVPSQRNLFDWTDEQGRLVRYFIEGPIDAQIAQLYFDEFHNRREAEAMPAFESLRRLPQGVRSADELDHPAFFRSALYHEIWRPQGLHRRLEGVVRGPGGQLLGSLVLYRGPGEARFTAQDEQRLAQALPLLAAGLMATGPAQPLRPDERQVPAAEPPETLLLTLQGEVCQASEGAHRLLLMAEGGASRETLALPLPTLAGRWLRLLLLRLRERAVAGPAALLAPPPSLSHETPAGRFVATGQLLRAAARSEPAPLALVTLQRLEPHRVALERVLQALPLTAGQQAVCRQLVAGRTHAQAAKALGVAPATVIDHLRKTLRTLDLRSGDELRHLLEGRAARP